MSENTLTLENKPKDNGNDLVAKVGNEKPVIIPNTKITVDGETVIFTGSGVEAKDGTLILHGETE